LNLDPCGVNKEIIATFALSPQLSSLFLFSSEASLLGDKNEPKSHQMPFLRTIFVRKGLVGSKTIKSGRRQVSRMLPPESSRKTRRHKVSSVWQRASVEGRSFGKRITEDPALFMPKLRIPIFTAIVLHSKFLFSLSEKFLTFSRRNRF
jgi:hypothetical protein